MEKVYIFPPNDPSTTPSHVIVDNFPPAVYYATRIDDVSTPNVMYVGKAAVSSITSAAVWQIQKVDSTSGTVITWANGNSLFTEIWDNRVSLPYS